MKTALYIILAVLFFSISSFEIYSQVVITNTDMPNYNEIYRLSLKNSIGTSFDYEDTGANFKWDISDISFNSSRQDTFIKVSSTPLVYYIYFSNNMDSARKATISSPSAMSIPAPGLEIKDVYYFYKESTENFSQVGFGAKINDIPIPVKYTHPDVWYKFPITYGSKDTSESGFSINIQAYGYLGETKKRYNHVDGWGLIIMGNDSVPVIRIKSVVDIEDTIYSSEYGQGYTLNRTETEYKWLASQIGVPLCKVVKRMSAISMEVFDSLFMYTTPVAHYIPNTQHISVYPNPATDYLYINISLQEGNTDICYSLMDITGKILKEKTFENASQFFIDKIDIGTLHLSPGIYLLTYRTSGYSGVSRFTVN